MKLSYLLIPILLFQACKEFQGSTVSVPNRPLEVHGDSIRLSAKASIDEDARVEKDSRYQLQPKLGEKNLQTIEVYDDAIAERVKKKGLDTAVQISIPYTPEMQGDKLAVDHFYAEDGDEEAEKIKETTGLAECCITSSELIRDDFRYMHTVSEKLDSVPLKLVTQVNFPIDVWKLNENSFSETDLTAIKDFLKSGKEGSEVRIRGNASPDGAIERNEVLAQKRAEEVSEWFQSELRSAGRENYLEMISSYSLDKNSEDWKGFLMLLKQTDLEDETKEKIVEIVQNQNLSPAEKENKIADLAGGSIYELEKILSPLRKTTLVIEGVRKAKSDMELDSLATAYSEDESGLVPEVIFSREEWLDAAARVTTGEGKRSLLMAFYEKYPDDYRIYNDLGILSLTQDSACPQVEDCPGFAGATNIPAEGDFEFEYETPEKELEIEREDDEFQYENEVGDKEVKIKNEPDEFKYEKETSDMEIKAKADRDENQYKYEREFDGGEVKIKKEDGAIRLKSGDVDISGEELENIPEELRKDYVTAKALFTLADSMELGAVQMDCKTRCIFADQGKLEAARDYFTKSLKERETQEAHYNLGILNARLGNYKEALYHLSQADNIPGAEYNLGLVKMMTGKLNEARNDLSEYIRKNPRDAYGYYALAVLGARMDDPGCVFVNLNRAIELNPELSAHAESNLEFREYRDDETFARALEGEVQF